MNAFPQFKTTIDGVDIQEAWARRAFPSLIYFRQADRGGHFAAWEHPELFAAELRTAFKSLR